MNRNRNRNVRAKQCTTIAKFESSKYIAYKGLQLKTDSELPKLSTFKTGYITKLAEEIGELFPEKHEGRSLSDVEVFDHRLFKGSTR